MGPEMDWDKGVLFVHVGGEEWGEFWLSRKI